jgi:hypothetical protein
MIGIDAEAESQFSLNTALINARRLYCRRLETSNEPCNGGLVIVSRSLSLESACSISFGSW